MVDSSSVFSHSKSSFSIPRLVWGVIVQGFIRIVRMALEIPMASKLGTPRYFAPKPQAIGSHNLWLIISMVLMKNCIGEPWNPAQLPKQPPSLDGG